MDRRMIWPVWALLLMLGVVAAVMIGCTAAQLAETQQGAQQVQSLTTQPVATVAVQGVAGGELALSVVGAVAGVVGTIAGYLATRRSASQQKSAAQSLAGALNAVRTAASDPAARAAIEGELARLPAQVQNILAAARS